MPCPGPQYFSNMFLSGKCPGPIPTLQTIKARTSRPIPDRAPTKSTRQSSNMEIFRNIPRYQNRPEKKKVRLSPISPDRHPKQTLLMIFPGSRYLSNIGILSNRPGQRPSWQATLTWDSNSLPEEFIEDLPPAIITRLPFDKTHYKGTL